MQYIVLLACLIGVAFCNYDDFYRPGGWGNNLQNPSWGAIGQPFQHEWPWMGWSFVDGLNQPVPTSVEHPSPRYVSNNVCKLVDQYEQYPQSRYGITGLTTYWGQFIAHEISQTPTGYEPLPIQIPKCDDVFDRGCAGDRWMSFNRSVWIDGSGYKYPRMIPNAATAYLDAGNVYGNSEFAQYLVRQYTGGQLRTTPYPPSKDGAYPPRLRDFPYDIQQKVLSGKYFDDYFLDNPVWKVPSYDLYICGEGRCNENPVTLSLHILWLREHNRVAGILQKAYPTWNDEQVFQAAKRYITAEIQKITYDEYLPAILGSFPQYKGYNAYTNPDISDFFSTTAFRMGHSSATRSIKRLEMDSYNTIKQGDLWLMHAYFDPSYLQYGVSSILRGAAYYPNSEIDGWVVKDLRDYLFGAGKPRWDLCAFNMMRAWDHGIPFYNEVRTSLGLSPVYNWDQYPTSIYGAKQSLANTYLHPDLVDPFVGGLLEDHVKGSTLGPLFHRSITEQFVRLREGDRFFYLNQLQNLAYLEKVLGPISYRSLAQVIKDNTAVYLCPNDVFRNSGY